MIAGLSLALSSGETVLITGRNGSGKSTLLRTLAGLLPKQAGSIEYDHADEETRGVETVHYLGYEDALKPTLTVEENLTFWAAMLAGRSLVQAIPLAASTTLTDGGGEAKAPKSHCSMAVEAALTAFAIGRLSTLPAAFLSAGQKRRAALAKLVLAPRPIWLLDEPLIALDVNAQATLTAIMNAHVETGGAILIASHQPLSLPHRQISLDLR